MDGKSLISIGAEYAYLMDRSDRMNAAGKEPPTAEQVAEVQQELAAIKADEAAKLEGYRKALSICEIEMAFLDAEEKAYKAMKEQRKTRIKNMLATVMLYLRMVGKTEAYCESLRRFVLCDNGGNPPLEYVPGTKPEDVPEQFHKKTVEYSFNTAEIIRVLKAGELLGFVQFGTRGQHVQVF